MNFEEEKAYLKSLIDTLNAEQIHNLRVYLDELLGGE